jgi:hypothetical protein
VLDPKNLATNRCISANPSSIAKRTSTSNSIIETVLGTNTISTLTASRNPALPGSLLGVPGGLLELAQRGLLRKLRQRGDLLAILLE